VAKISSVLICKYEENNIEACLESVQWVDEIIVIDAESTDKTAELAKKFTDKVFIRKWEGFSSQRKFGLEQCNGEWIFPIDADERCTEELKKEILEKINSADLKQNGFKIPRKSFYKNHWVKHCGWYPGYQLRLFKKTKANVTDRLVHESYAVNGETGLLKNDLLHYTITSAKNYIEKINHYTSLQASEKNKRGKVGFIKLLFRPFWAFFFMYIIKAGFLDGTAGLIVSYFNFITNILIYTKIWEMQNSHKDDKFK
jgi:glycosyltransferase involved in cell wall biosynthesis